MKVRVLLLFAVCAFDVAACGSRTGLDFARATPRTVDAGTDAHAADAGGHDGPCEWRFAPAAKYAVSGYPADITIGDFDGDGFSDVLTVNSDSTQIALLKNSGGGRLTLQGAGAVGTSVAGFASADFNGDGSLDLAVLNPNPGSASSVNVFFNDGGGAFSSMNAYQMPAGAFGIVAGDFDADGRPDLAVSDGSMNVDLLINSGGGAFRYGSQLPTGSLGAIYLTAADVDRNGALDIGVAGTFSVALLFNQGNAQFGVRAVYDYSSACDYPGPLIAGDLSGDGYPDLARTCYQAGSKVVVRTNYGNGALGDELSYGVGQWPFGIVLGDFTGHGRNDLAVANAVSDENSISVLANSGGGTFAPQVSYEASGPKFIAAGDLNGDGHADLATAGSPDYPASNGTVSVLLSICE